MTKKEAKRNYLRSTRNNTEKYDDFSERGR